MHFITLETSIKAIKTLILVIVQLLYIFIYKYTYILAGLYKDCQAVNSQREN